MTSNNHRFIGREKQLKSLLDQLRKRSSATIVYGKRKVGKTTLILEASARLGKPFVYYECVKDTEEANVESLLNECKRIGVVPGQFGLGRKTFLDLFQYLDSLGKPLAIAIDEYPYLREFTPAETVDSSFQKIIDNHITNVSLVLSGSHMAIMKSLLREDNALYGRFGLNLFLQEFDYHDASLFYPDKTPYEKAGFYAVFGGSPYVLRAIDPDKGLRENIVGLLLPQDSVISLYASSLLLSEVGNKAQSERLLSCLGNGRKRYGELEETIDPRRTGNLARIINPLIGMGLIGKQYPINKPGDPRKAFYCIEDNLLRFYYTFLHPHRSPLALYDPDRAYEVFIEPGLTQYLSRRFEGIARQFVWRRINAGEFVGALDVGTYYYDDPVARKNGEFDVAVLRGDGVDIIEAKYWSKPMDKQEVHREKGQILAIKELAVAKIGFVSINGFDADVTGLDYMFDGDDLYR
jgi:AAA+ ATPase superfamily predicted ATPase